MYSFLKECGIDSSSIGMVQVLINDVIQQRAEFFPNARTCHCETLLQLLGLLFPGETTLPNSLIDRWMFVLYYNEERLVNNTTKQYYTQECSC